MDCSIFNVGGEVDVDQIRFHLVWLSNMGLRFSFNFILPQMSEQRHLYKRNLRKCISSVFITYLSLTSFPRNSNRILVCKLELGSVGQKDA